ncbi:hypothetical protein SAMN04487895_101706 [Paenibacillus sophorae]|uniref:HNH endonuclease n=1 Tax=Paenibacillus sophorae TaxID=1333845 RepID=A0A1H8GZU7_9BACL|nr:HNH endonuclease [Paenibacillus sophorae]QWU14397.1 HNH endonuclease [Paenibacillus sophorae]SEN49523.1 hypothetical protein SAMN04487895_101706 [Paenibacillus sophorae]
MEKKIDDLIGEKFGKWFVLEQGPKKEKTNLKQWLCVCTECHRTKKLVPETYLVRGLSKSCGCNRNMKKLKDLTGKRFGNLVVVQRVGLSGHTSTWLCQCDCGGDKIVPRNDLKRKDGRQITHCGCKNKESINKFFECDTYFVGMTSKGWEFYFNVEDFELISKYSWCMDDNGYVRSRETDELGNVRTISLHRLLLNAKNNDIVDHKNNTPCDNRRANIRICTVADNTRNRTPKNESLNISGIKQYENGKYIAGIHINKKYIHLGTFNNFEDAFSTRKEAEIKYFGEFRYQGNEE